MPTDANPPERMVLLMDGNIPDETKDLVEMRTMSDLPADTEQTVGRTLGHRRSVNWAPTVMSRELLQIPLWNNPELAAKPAFEGAPFTREFVHRDTSVTSRRRVETINVLKCKNERRQLSPHGALRYLDLDVLMAVTYMATEQRSRGIEIDQVQFMRTMGYDDLAQAPYLALKASFERLRHTMIKVYDLDGRGEAMPDERTYQLISTFHETASNGRARRLEVMIGDWWLKAMKESSWQLVDVGAYVHLVRNHRLNGLARVLYLYLSSVRSRDNFFQVKLDWIQERFAPLRSTGHYRHEHPLTPNSDLRAAIELLCAEKVLTIMPINAPEGRPLDGYLRGYFCPSKRFASYLRTDLKPRQLLIFENDGPDIFQAPPPAEALPTPEDDAVPPEAKRDPFLDYIEALISFVQKRYKFRIPNALMAQARAKGWQPIGILHVLVTSLDKATDNHAGYAASVLRRGMYDPSVREGFEQLHDKHQSTLDTLTKDQFAPRWDAARRMVLPPEVNLDERRKEAKLGLPAPAQAPRRQRRPTLRGNLVE